MKYTQEQASAFYATANTHISEEAFLAFVDNQSRSFSTTTGVTLEQLLTQHLMEAEECYVGEYKSFGALAEQQVDEGLWGTIPDNLVNYIDYEKIGNDLRLSGDIWESNGHFFSGNY
jgi:antirestriction protein